MTSPRYGEEFNYDRDVVSVASGGIVSQEVGGPTKPDGSAVLRHSGYE